MSTVWQILLTSAVIVTAATGVAEAGEPPQKPDAASKTKLTVLFPGPAEIRAALDAQGLHPVQPKAEDLRIAKTDWSKLPEAQRRLRLGSLLGALGFAAATQDQQTIGAHLDEIVVAARANGIPDDAACLNSARTLSTKVKAGAISSAKLVSALDDLRRVALSDAAKVIPEDGRITISAGAWLRGGALLAKQVKTDDEAKKLGALVARKELIALLSPAKAAKPSAEDAERQKTVDRLLELTQKAVLNRTDVLEIASLAEKLLG